MITGKNYIGYSLSGNGTKTYKTFNPKTNQENPTVFIEATSEEIDKALQLATTAFPIYRNIPGKKRAQFLNAIGDEILNLGDELIQIYMTETGLSEGRA